MPVLKKFFYALCLFTGLMLFMAPLHADSKKKDEDVKPLAYVLQVKGVVSPAMRDLVSRHLVYASERGANIMILQLHTPGGLYNSMQEIIQDILDSPVPVATYVAPAGSHAASAGTYILYASHIAAMAPSTNLGAATPVQMNDSGPQKQQDKDVPTQGSPMDQKMVNDASAYIRSLAEMRGRNAEWAERAVRSAESLTATEALSKKVIDIIADDIPTLLDQMDGRTVKMKEGKTMKLKTRGAIVETVVPDWRHKLLEVITHPNVALLLMSLGFYGLVYEFANPGALLPGIVGAICLLLGLFALNILPINYAGLALIFVGLALMAGEALTPSFGIMGVGGAVAFFAGAMMLIDSDTPDYGVDILVAGSITFVSVAFLSIILALVLKAQRRPKTTGIEELTTAVGEIMTWSQGQGQVRVTGEVWKAISSGEAILQKGDKVRIVGINGLILTVEEHKE
ncbi:MAG: NfeD family protein [Alphaproteobacteria bacterium]